MAEWPNVPDSKSGVPQGTVGSNPTLSANDKFLTAHFSPNKPPRSPCFPVKQGLFCVYASYAVFLESRFLWVTIRVIKPLPTRCHAVTHKQLIHRRAPWKTKESLELATLAWVSWFNYHRLMEPIGYIPSSEAEANYFRQLAENTETSLFTLTKQPPRKPGAIH